MTKINVIKILTSTVNHLICLILLFRVAEKTANAFSGGRYNFTQTVNSSVLVMPLVIFCVGLTEGRS